MARQPAHLTSEDEGLLNSIGWQIAMAVRNARLYQAVQRKEQEHSEMFAPGHCRAGGGAQTDWRANYTTKQAKDLQR